MTPEARPMRKEEAIARLKANAVPYVGSYIEEENRYGLMMVDSKLFAEVIAALESTDTTLLALRAQIEALPTEWFCDGEDTTPKGSVSRAKVLALIDAELGKAAEDERR